jgi:hypothetical protein
MEDVPLLRSFGEGQVARPSGADNARYFIWKEKSPNPSGTLSRLGRLPKGCLVCLQPSWARQVGLAIDYVQFGIIFAPIQRASISTSVVHPTWFRLNHAVEECPNARWSCAQNIQQLSRRPTRLLGFIDCWFLSIPNRRTIDQVIVDRKRHEAARVREEFATVS